MACLVSDLLLWFTVLSNYICQIQSDIWLQEISTLFRQVLFAIFYLITSIVLIECKIVHNFHLQIWPANIKAKHRNPNRKFVSVKEIRKRRKIVKLLSFKLCDRTRDGKQMHWILNLQIKIKRHGNECNINDFLLSKLVRGCPV